MQSYAFFLRFKTLPKGERFYRYFLKAFFTISSGEGVSAVFSGAGAAAGSGALAGGEAGGATGAGISSAAKILPEAR